MFVSLAFCGKRLSVNAIPLGTFEKAKACQYRESETCNCNVEECRKNSRPSSDLIPHNMQSRNAPEEPQQPESEFCLHLACT